jgi:uncharacterized phage-associated protein
MTDNQYIYLNSIAYVANQFNNRTIDFHKLFKILYFAEQKHLVKYGGKLVDDNFVAMDNGPVPSSMYTMLKALKSFSLYPDEIKKSLIVRGFNITCAIDVDMDWLSESEISCLTESINENRNLNFNQLSDKSHDEAWKEGYNMRTEKIAEAGGANEDMVAYIMSNLENTAH